MPTKPYYGKARVRFPPASPCTDLSSAPGRFEARKPVGLYPSPSHTEAGRMALEPPGTIVGREGGNSIEPGDYSFVGIDTITFTTRLSCLTNSRELV